MKKQFSKLIALICTMAMLLTVMPVCTYAEFAGDEVAVPLLVGMGLDECSMVSSEIAAVRYQIRGISAEQMKHLVERVLAAVTVKEVKQLLER